MGEHAKADRSSSALRVERRGRGLTSAVDGARARSQAGDQATPSDRPHPPLDGSLGARPRRPARPHHRRRQRVPADARRNRLRSAAVRPAGVGRAGRLLRALQARSRRRRQRDARRGLADLPLRDRRLVRRVRRHSGVCPVASARRPRRRLLGTRVGGHPRLPQHRPHAAAPPGRAEDTRGGGRCRAGRPGDRPQGAAPAELRARPSGLRGSQSAAAARGAGPPPGAGLDRRADRHPPHQRHRPRRVGVYRRSSGRAGRRPRLQRAGRPGRHRPAPVRGRRQPRRRLLARGHAATRADAPGARRVAPAGQAHHGHRRRAFRAGRALAALPRDRDRNSPERLRPGLLPPDPHRPARRSRFTIVKFRTMVPTPRSARPRWRT